MQNDLTQEKIECYINDKLDLKQKGEIRTYSCLSEQLYPFVLHNDGNHYCLFHLPSPEKDAEAFEKFFRQKLLSVESWINSLSALPVEERKIAESTVGYDFHCLWFPLRIDLSTYNFRAIAIFNFAYFSKGATFANATFSEGVYFYEATFNQAVDFRSAIFEELSHFSGAIFEGYANFRIAIFIEDVLFELARFTEETDFRSTTFRKGAYFHRIKIAENSKLSFIWTSFQQLARFDEAIIKGYLHFEAGEGDIFDGKWLSPLIGDKRPEIEKRHTSVFEGKAEFHHLGAEKPERITFNKVRLRPSWFVNADSRKFIFTDITWENYKSKESELNQELEELENRLFRKPHNYQLLTIALRNLAANAEEYNRFEESSKFRRMAFETERLQRKNKIFERWVETYHCSKVAGELWQKLKDIPYDMLHFAYRWTSSYGESWRWATFVLLSLILLVFPIIYANTNFYVCPVEKTNLSNSSICQTRTLTFGEGTRQSLATATLQTVETRKPNSSASETFTILEKVFAPLQAALLALAIRRKFMR